MVGRCVPCCVVSRRQGSAVNAALDVKSVLPRPLPVHLVGHHVNGAACTLCGDGRTVVIMAPVAERVAAVGVHARLAGCSTAVRTLPLLSRGQMIAHAATRLMAQPWDRWFSAYTPSEWRRRR